METKQIINVVDVKDVIIKGQVEFNGKLEDITITKFDTKNDVVAFYLNVMGKKFYVGAGKDTPKLSQITNITITTK